MRASDTVSSVMRASQKGNTRNFLSGVCTVAFFTARVTATDLPHKYLLQLQSFLYFACDYSMKRVVLFITL